MIRRFGPWPLVMANMVMMVVVIAAIRLRGQAREEETRERFSAYALCFWGGAPVEDPGLGLPPEERAHYAGRVLFADPEWPDSCRAALAAVSPDDARLLFPGVKAAEAVVRDAVALVDEQLVLLAAHRASMEDPGVGRVPARPREASGRLLAALSELVRATGGQVEPGALAFALPDQAPLAEPARVPLQTSVAAPIRMGARADGLQATALGPRVVSHVRVGGGRTYFERTRRPALVREIIWGRGGPWLLFATAEERCQQDVSRCATRALGLSPLGRAGDPPASPVWFAAHPAGPARETLRVSLERSGLATVDVAAVSPSGEAVEVRRFLSRSLMDPAAGPPTPRTASWPLPGSNASSTVLLEEGNPTWALWTRPDETHTALLEMALVPGAEPAEGMRLTGRNAELLGCKAPHGRWRLLRTDRAAAVTFAPMGGAAVDPAARHVHRLPLHLSPDTESEPARSADEAALRIVCDDEQAHVAVVAAGVLQVLSCRPTTGCTMARSVARGAHRFDVARSDGVTLLAYVGAGTDSHVRVVTLGEEAEPSEPRLAAVCWEPAEGFCGPPLLAASHGRFLLATREQGNLRVLESSDGGRTFEAMRGIR